MGEIYLSFAAFVYYTKGKNYNMKCHIDGFVSFWYEEENPNTHILQIIMGVKDNDCGYVVIDIESLDILFRKDKDLIEELKTKCSRPHIPQGGMNDLYHCSVPVNIRKEIGIEINNGAVIKCQRIQ